MKQDMHKEFLRLPEKGAPYKPRDLPFVTPEEEAACIFIYVPAAIRALLKYNSRVKHKIVWQQYGNSLRVFRLNSKCLVITLIELSMVQ